MNFGKVIRNVFRKAFSRVSGILSSMVFSIRDCLWVFLGNGFYHAAGMATIVKIHT